MTKPHTAKEYSSKLGQVHGMKVIVLTWGGLHEVPSNVGNRIRKETLTMQKSAEAIVPK